MRNLEDCKAEIFRRSEERIKERKRNRNCVLACCIPLCLLLVTGGLYIRPLLEPIDECSKSGGTNKISDRELGGLNFELYGHVVEYVSVTLTEGVGSAAVSKKITNTETLGNLYGRMAMYFDLSGTDVVGGLDGADSVTDGVAETTGKESDADGLDRDIIEDELKFKYALEEKPADYILVFRESTGKETEFRLYQNYLYNESNGCVVTLSDGQLAELRTKLEQIVTQED